MLRSLLNRKNFSIQKVEALRNTEISKSISETSLYLLEDMHIPLNLYTVDKRLKTKYTKG